MQGVNLAGKMPAGEDLTSYIVIGPGWPHT